MKTINVTFSIPESTNIMLHSYVKKRGLSKFVTRAIEKALQEEKNSLKSAYLEAEKDSDTQAVMEDWAALDGEDWDG